MKYRAETNLVLAGEVMNCCVV